MMKGIISTCFCLLFLSHSLSAQSNYVDSLTQLLEVNQPDSNRLGVLLRLTEKFYMEDTKKAFPYAEEAKSLSLQLNDLSNLAEVQYYLSYLYYFDYKDEEALIAADSCKQLYILINTPKYSCDCLYIQGAIYMGLGKKEEGRKSYEEGLEMGKKYEYLRAIINNSKGLGDIAETDGDYEKALEYYQLSMEGEEKEDNAHGQGVAYNDLGRIYDSMGQYEKGLSKYLEGLAWAEKYNLNRLQATFLSNIAGIHFRQKNYSKAEEFAEKGLEKFRENSDRRGEAKSIQTLGNCAFNQGEFQLALDYFMKARDIQEEIKYKRGLTFAYFNMGKSYHKLGQKKEAIKFHEKSLELREELGFKSGQAGSHKALGQLWTQEGNYKKALFHLKKGEQIAGEKELIEEQEGIYKNLAQYYEARGNFKQAFSYFEQYAQTRDSLLNKDRNKQIADMQTRYETSQKEQEILRQEKEIAELDAQKSGAIIQRNAFISGGLILSILAFLGLRINRIQRERNDKKALAEALLFTQEEERKRIARDLHDGIGQSLLLIKKQLLNNASISAENQHMISETLEEVRSVSRDLHPFQLEKFGLKAALEEAILKVERSSDLFISKELIELDQYLPQAAHIHVFRTVQEALSNIIKHAEATAAKVSAELKDNEVLIQIRDNGKGFDHELEIVTSKSLGLRTMFERISAIGGKLKIEKGNNGKGSNLSISIPIQNM
ncbi:MAG: tetratricopeptide repeat protein [Bacteroidia bacterium]|nr:tetratricopeptide repeat protein [Bacteroidia bacterium]